MGGNETTAGSLASFLINIIKFPHVYAKLMAPDGDFSRENLALPDPQFPYLAAVIRESNRWTPPAPGYFPRVISKGGIATRDGRFIPEGTEVVMNFKMCMWDKAVWGEDADEFVPERWLDERAHASEMNNLVYGYGPSKCIGMHLADQMLLIATRAVSAFMSYVCVCVCF